jgi:hypothetical protein
MYCYKGRAEIAYCGVIPVLASDWDDTIKFKVVCLKEA